MRIPNKIRMFGYDWKIKKTGKDGGDVTWSNRTISVGTKYKEQEAILLHEIIEAILMELHFRFYGQESNMEYQFHFSHEGLCKFHKMLFQVLKDNKLI
jgi:hypothetical protein